MTVAATDSRSPISCKIVFLQNLAYESGFYRLYKIPYPTIFMDFNVQNILTAVIVLHGHRFNKKTSKAERGDL